MGFHARSGARKEGRAIRRGSHGRGVSSSMARGGLTGGGSRGSEGASGLRRASGGCTATLSMMVKPMEAAARPGAASFSGELPLLAVAAS
jgi:hypothetical protein